MNCLAEKFEGRYGLVHPCLAYSLLLDKKIACSCEGDTLTLVNLAILSKFFNEPCFMTNILPLSLLPEVAKKLNIPLNEFDPKRTVILGHCSYLEPVPLSIFLLNYSIRRKIDKVHKSGVTVDAEISEGPLTLIKFYYSLRRFKS